ncbi:MAG TPA: choice-of-anchor D domain-containing protein [Terracidiphilus sp.]|nr:choice-of-anchor D domain-containing protein [Terracidiphilus sp.]
MSGASNLESDFLKMGGNLAVNQNPLGRIRGHFGFMVPNSLVCKLSSMTGSGSDSCTVSLNGTATTNTIVNLSSSNASVSVPSSVTITKNSSTATFNATIATVTSSATVTLAAAANGGSAATKLQVGAVVATLTASTSSMNFGNVVAGQTATQSFVLSSVGTQPVIISGISSTATQFIASGITTPLTLNPGQTATLAVKFSPQVASAFSGTLSIATNSSQGNLTENLTGAGIPASTVGSLSCASNSMSGAGTDACTVTLTTAAPSTGLSVALGSSNSVVTVPSSVAIAAGAKSVGFTATAASCTSAQSATLTATGGGTSATFSLQLSSGQPKLSINAASISFGNVVINSVATQSLTLSSIGTAALNVTAASSTGTGFTVIGATFPLTLNVGQTATLNVQFDPAATGAVTGKLTIASNSSTGATTTVSLSGTGLSHQVQLSWNAPSGSGATIAGYRVYRATSGTSSYQLLNSALNSQMTFVDSTVHSSTSYQYYVTTVNSSGLESVPSNTATVSVP